MDGRHICRPVCFCLSFIDTFDVAFILIEDINVTLDVMFGRFIVVFFLAKLPLFNMMDDAFRLTESATILNKKIEDTLVLGLKFNTKIKWKKLQTTVDFPEKEPKLIKIIRGFMARLARVSPADIPN